MNAEELSPDAPAGEVAGAPPGEHAGSAGALRFRAAGPEDVDEVVAIVESAYRGEESRGGWTTEAHLLDGQRTDPDQVGSLMEGPASMIVLAQASGRVVGTFHIERTDPDTAYFGMFAVRPGHQGGGTGRAMVGEARRIASSWGCGRIRMTVIRQRTDLIAWYERLGFSPTGETEPFPYGDERFGRPKQPDLEFIVLSGQLSVPGAGR